MVRTFLYSIIIISLLIPDKHAVCQVKTSKASTALQTNENRDALKSKHQYTISENKTAFIAQQNDTLLSDWKTYSNSEFGLSFEYPSTWVKLGKETNAIDRNGIVLSKMFTLTDTISQSTFHLEYHLPPYGAELFKNAQDQLTSLRSASLTGAKQTQIAGSKGLQFFSTMNSDIKGNIYNPPLKFVHIIFLDKQQTGAISVEFKTVLSNNKTELIKLNQSLSTFKFTN